MKKIIKIFFRDAKRLSTNVVATVIIIGLCIVPSLYAWFNILSNWNPYGPEATENLKIAVYSSDAGVEELGFELNVGEKVVEGLKTNDTIGWVFVDSEDEAVEGVYSGEYYAALVVPKDFTAQMVSFLNGEVEHPEITYYENEKKNAIAPKITGKAKTAVKEQVNSTFISTVAKVAMELGNSLADMDGDTTMLGTVKGDLKQLDADLLSYISILNTFINVTDTVSTLIQTTQVVIPDLDAMVSNGENTVNAMQGAVNAGSSSISTISVMMNYSFTVIRDSLDQVNKLVSGCAETVEGVSGNVDADLIAAKAILPYLRQIYDSTVGGLKEELQNNENIEGNTELIADIDELSASLQTIENDINTVLTDAGNGAESIKTLKSQIASEVGSCKTRLQKLEDTYNLSVKPAIDKTVTDMNTALSSAESTIGSLNADFSGISDVLDNYLEVVNSGSSSLTESKKMAEELEEDLASIITQIDGALSDESFSKFEEILMTNPEKLGEFVSSPVIIESKAIYEIKTYGSAMAPFYTILALWVGALILVAIIHVKVLPEEGTEAANSVEQFFGRYIVFYLVGQVQTLLAVLGNLFYIGIQCKHPFLLWFAASICSLCFTLMIYALTVAFGNIGEAIAVVIMVIQVAGAGGTFPVEVLPKVYQAIYKYLPFTYGMNAMRETIGGMYKLDYLINILKLGVCILISLLIGLVIAIPFRKLNKKIEESKKKTDLLL